MVFLIVKITVLKYQMARMVVLVRLTQTMLELIAQVVLNALIVVLPLGTVAWIRKIRMKMA